MKRAPIVIAGTLVGLIGVLKFHTAPVSLASPAGSTLPAASAAGSSPASGSSPAARAGSTASRTKIGPAVYYDYGTLSVRVTVSGHKIVKVAIASLDDGSNPRSQYIDQQSIPMLEREVLQAQSANIQ